MRRTIIKACAILIGILCMFYMYKGYVGYQMVKGIVDQPPIVFSVRFKNGDRGTFKYNIKNRKYEQISDYIFQELSYSDDYEKIIGVIWEDRFQGIAELDMRDYTFTTIINISDLNKYVKQLGLEEIKYDIPGEAELRMPKYYKDGYTFFWGYYSTHICYIKPVKNTWDISIVNSGKFLGYSYFIKEEYMENKLFLETDETLMSKNEDRGTIIERNIGEDNKEGVLDIELPDLLDSDGLMDMPVDMSKIAYYEEPEIYIYDLHTRKKKHVTNQCLFNQNIIELKFSPDGKYMLYTVGDNPFFGGSFYRRTFYLVDIESGNKTKLVKWRTGDMFYGIDW